MLNFFRSFLFCFFLILACLSFLEQKGSAQERKIGIINLSSNMLFEIENMKPGDWSEREVILKNKEKKEILYKCTIRQVKGSKQLFNILALTITDKNHHVIFDGSLKEFAGFDSRSIQAFGKDHLTFLIRFPEHAGNEFQGLKTSFEMVFATDALNIQTFVNNGKADGDFLLPNTATNHYVFTIIGFLFILAGAIYILLKKRKNHSHSN